MPPGEHASLPRITVVTPSYNQAAYIEETIRSVLLQNHPNLEYFVMDGGSTDGTVEILKKYDRWITGWVSEKDRGQSHAINKGFERATGSLRAYMNSDDFYLPGAFRAVVESHRQDPSAGLFHGTCVYIDVEGRRLGTQRGAIHELHEILDLWRVWWGRRQFVQPEVFWTADFAARAGAFREDLHYVMDYDYWVRLLIAGARVRTVDAEVSCFRITPDQKSRQNARVAEELRTLVRPLLWDSGLPIPAHRRRALKHAWLYDVHVLGTLADSVGRNEPALMRYGRVAGKVARHPGLLAAPPLWQRIRKTWRGR